MKYQMEHSNGMQSEAVESGASVRIEVGMGEVESGGMHITECQINVSQKSSLFLIGKS